MWWTGAAADGGWGISLWKLCRRPPLPPHPLRSGGQSKCHIIWIIKRPKRRRRRTTTFRSRDGINTPSSPTVRDPFVWARRHRKYKNKLTNVCSTQADYRLVAFYDSFNDRRLQNGVVSLFSASSHLRHFFLFIQHNSSRAPTVTGVVVALSRWWRHRFFSWRALLFRDSFCLMDKCCCCCCCSSCRVCVCVCADSRSTTVNRLNASGRLLLCPFSLFTIQKGAKVPFLSIDFRQQRKKERKELWMFRWWCRWRVTLSVVTWSSIFSRRWPHDRAHVIKEGDEGE